MSPKWIEEEKEVFQLMRDTGFMPEDAPDPEFAEIQPPGT
jgi:hypothetical protein